MIPHNPEIDQIDRASVSSRRAIVGPIAASIAFVMELTLVPLLLPMMQVQFSLAMSELAWVFNSYGIAVAIGVFVGGWLGDAFDTTKVFRAGAAFFASGSLLTAFAGSFEMLIAGRALQGFGGGVFSPLVPLLLTRAAPRRPGKILIVWGSVAGYVAAFAPLLYGGLVQGYGWNLAFVFTGLIAVIAVLILDGSPLKDNVASFSCSAPGYLALFRSRKLWIMFVYVFCTYGPITYYLFRLPVWLENNKLGTASIGFTLSIMWLSFSGLSTLLRNKVDEPHLQTITLAAPILIGVGLPLLYFEENLLCLVLSSALVGSGLACSNAPSTQLILRFAPEGMSAVSASLDITFARLGGVATVAILAQAEFVHALTAILLLCLVAVFCALIAISRLGQGDPGH